MKTIWIFVALTAALLAQTIEAPQLSGVVVDQSGRVVSGASVWLRVPGSAPGISTITGVDGRYRFFGLKSAVDYEVRAGYEGLASPVREFRLSGADERAGIQLRLAAAIQFEDIASKAGLDFTLRNGATGRAYQPEIMLGGVAAFDFDGDGCTDLFFTNGASLPGLIKTGPEYSNRLFRNKCDGTFADVTQGSGLSGEGYSMGVAAGDFDNDGRMDLFVTGVRGNHLYRNLGLGKFEDVTVTARLNRGGPVWSVSAGWFDFDNDGLLDLFVANYVTWSPELDKCSDKGGSFYCHPRAYNGLPNNLFRNNGDGTFTDVTATSGIGASVGKGMGVAFGDYNGDGLTDVFVANDSVPNFLFQNLGRGKFREVALEAGVAFRPDGRPVAGMGVDFRDLDDDGRDDIALNAMYFDTFPLYRNSGSPTAFVDRTEQSGIAFATHRLTGWGMGIFDFDNDGFKDLFYATSHFPGSEPYIQSPAAIANHVLRNNGTGYFEDVSALAGSSFQQTGLHHGVAFADFDNDGLVDAAVTTVNGPVRLFRNVSPKSSHWLAVRLRGMKSNRDGLGAKVRLTLPTGEFRYNRATTSVGYASSSEPLVRFGLGPYEGVSELLIRWPDGQMQTLRDVAGDRVVNVMEK